MTDVPRRLVSQRARYWSARLAILAVLPVILMTRSVWGDDPWVYVTLESLGVVCVMAAVLGRFWAILYIGGRKNQAVVRDGPYSVCRHPLYACSTLGAVGLGLMFGSVLLAVTLGALALAILSATAAREETALRAAFGTDYDAYVHDVPRLIPDPRRFTTPPEVTFRAAALRTNLWDALAFLALIPLAQVVKLLREALPEAALRLP